jgi:MraZ protein
LAFRGQHEHNLDAKDRVTIPARFRAALADGVVLSEGLDPCVEVYPVGAYAEFEQRFLAGLNPFEREGRMMQRRFHSRSVDEALDSAGRIHLPKHLIEHAGLEGTCVVAGVMNRLEIWNPDRWAEENSQIDAGAGEISEGLAGGGRGSGGPE